MYTSTYSTPTNTHTLLTNTQSYTNTTAFINCKQQFRTCMTLFIENIIYLVFNKDKHISRGGSAAEFLYLRVPCRYAAAPPSMPICTSRRCAGALKVFKVRCTAQFLSTIQ